MYKFVAVKGLMLSLLEKQSVKGRFPAAEGAVSTVAASVSAVVSAVVSRGVS